MELHDLLEMSRIIDFNFTEANKEIQRILKKENIDGFFLEEQTLNLYQCFGNKSSNSGEYWFVIFNDDQTDIHFIVKFKEDMIFIDDKKYQVLVPFHTYKKTNSEKLNSITKRVYSYINKKFNKPILSDKKQSENMIILWLTWFENKSKYGIKDFKFIDEKNKKTLDMGDLKQLEFGFHGGFEHHEQYRMLVDFHNIIKEASPIILEKKNMGIFFGKKGRDWVGKSNNE